MTGPIHHSNFAGVPNICCQVKCVLWLKQAGPSLLYTSALLTEADIKALQMETFETKMCLWHKLLGWKGLGPQEEWGPYHMQKDGGGLLGEGKDLNKGFFVLLDSANFKGFMM